MIVATFFRGTTALGARDTGERLGRLLELVRDACPEHAWLLLPAVLGVGVAVGFWSPAGRGARDPDRVRLMLPLCVFHGALLVISALELLPILPYQMIWLLLMQNLLMGK